MAALKAWLESHDFLLKRANPLFRREMKLAGRTYPSMKKNPEMKFKN